MARAVVYSHRFNFLAQLKFFNSRVTRAFTRQAIVGERCVDTMHQTSSGRSFCELSGTIEQAPADGVELRHGVAHVRAEGGVHGFLERLQAVRRGNDVGAQDFHSDHVGSLLGHVHLSPVVGALG